MVNFVKFFMMLALILTAGCASQQSTDSDTPIASEQSVDVAASTETQNDPNEVICRREIVTGSNFRRRVCLTRAERGEMRAGSREVFNERIIRGGSPGPTE